MSNEEANQILKELYEVSPEKLNDKAKRLFEAMMKIADERDSVKADLYEANNRINDLLDIVKQKNKKIGTKNAKIECLNIIHESYKEMVKENNYISKEESEKDIQRCRLERLVYGGAWGYDFNGYGSMDWKNINLFHFSFFVYFHLFISK